MSDGSKGATYVGFSSAGALDEHDEDDDGGADEDRGNVKEAAEEEEEEAVDGLAGVEASLTKWSSVASLALAWLCSSSLSCSLVVATDLRPKWPPHYSSKAIKRSSFNPSSSVRLCGANLKSPGTSGTDRAGPGGDVSCAREQSRSC
jgi:beta-phosphoglucomutase-like phosphatase (HAD superfamily)